MNRNRPSLQRRLAAWGWLGRSLPCMPRARLAGLDPTWRPLLRTALVLSALFAGLGSARAEADPATALSPTSPALNAPVVCPPALPRVTRSAPPSDRGMLWRITRDGRSSWLYGTVHVGKPEWQHFGPRVQAALNASEVLALEVDPNDPQLAAELADTGPPVTLPPALEARLAQAVARACVDAALLAPMHPLLQASFLAVLEARWLGLDPAYAMEQLLLAQVRGQGRPVVALETAAQQKAALLQTAPAPAGRASADRRVPAANEGDAQTLASLTQTLAQLEDQSARRVLARLVQAWERGDVDLLAQYERWCECVQTADDRAALARLNDDRNPALAAGIVAQHRAGRRVFAAVGALHMTGPKALPLLLAQQGFRVERVAFAR